MSSSEPSGVVVGVDVGGTKVLAAVVGPDGTPGTPVEVPTPGRTVGVDVLEDALDRAVTLARGERPLIAVGLSAAGFVDRTGDRVMFAPHLPWRDAPVRERLSRRWQVPVAVENDATCALVAEHAWGTARGRDTVVLVTVGTGIGGGLVVHGRLTRGANGMAAEYGHMTVVPDGLPCECGGQGCWEQYASGRALVRAARAAHLAFVEPDSSGAGSNARTLLEEQCDGDLARLDGPMVTAAAQAGDSSALEAFEVVGSWLGAGLANLVAALDPELVVVGGGVSRAGDLLLAPAREALAQHLVGGSHRVVPDVVAAVTGAEAGLVGAATLAMRLP
ncbi:ROK family protein [Nocardioides yefusunii]|uniref:ROK family protein n=1 Tax=Nocardioides yefusunii TaxID=2500546 RepID=A0ABW1QV43_9ACTN|nr:ROK family protein [Nocardioides yefusunii]